MARDMRTIGGWRSPRTRDAPGPLVVVPTVEGAVVIRRVSPLPAGACSILSVAGDFRALPGSERCADLTGPAGPMARAAREAIGAWDIGFDRPPDRNRGWEAGVVVAVTACRQGTRLAEAIDTAGRLVVASGSVDGDLRLMAQPDPKIGNAAISRLVDQARSRGIDVVTIGCTIPESDVESAVLSAGERLDPERVACLLWPTEPGGSIVPLGARRALFAVTAMVVLAAAAFGLAGSAVDSPAPARSAAAPIGIDTAAIRPPPESEPARLRDAGLRITLLRAPRHHRCEEIAFEQIAAEREPVSVETGRLSLAGRNDVCGLEIERVSMPGEVRLSAEGSTRLGLIETRAGSDGTHQITRLLFGVAARTLDRFRIDLIGDDGGIAESVVVDVTADRSPRR